jgi:flagellar motility protein MotE (MotC chaperone)
MTRVPRWMLTMAVAATLLGWPTASALSQDGSPSAEWRDNPCLLPEELTVVEMMSSRTRELDQREELVLLKEQALAERQRAVVGELERLGQLQGEIEELLLARAEARRDGAASLVQMVNSMRSSEAAAMLSEMDPVLAAAVLERLSPRQAGKILGGMNPRIAAKLSTSLAVDPIEVEIAGKEEP